MTGLNIQIICNTCIDPPNGAHIVLTKILFCNLVENIILHELIHIGILNDMIAILKTVWEMCKCKKKGLKNLKNNILKKL